MSKYVGESEKLIKTLFNLAREKQPSIIFIDEVDSMCGNRSDGENEASRRVKTEFLVQMQGVGKDDKGVLVLGATNLPWALDPAIRRRFERRIYIPLPEFEARLGMLKRGMKDNKHSLTDQDFDELAKRSEDFSGSDISILVRDAVYAPVRLLQTATKFKEMNGKFMPCRPGESGQPGTWMDFPKEKVEIGIVTKEDFYESLKRTKPSVDKKQLQEYEEFTKSFGQDG
jgi:vacuolar protein-sorting-associated protein 4